ncbi:MAG: chemotaxis protein CheW [Bryobacterales bacterium]|nr:chemotaxis protein CheW [Bryobacteraceae bacterium]MDW8129872.1 chemotaxis protein CheW [Bryobacterales bacterium]
MDEQEIIREFLIESHENLARLDQEMVELEKRPQDGELLASIFRTIHTIKGTCGFLGFTRLEAVAHLTENILNQLRNGERVLTPALATLILEAVDAIKQMLERIERTGSEGEEGYDELRRRLEAAWRGEPVQTTASVEGARELRPKPSQPRGQGGRKRRGKGARDAEPQAIEQAGPTPSLGTPQGLQAAATGSAAPSREADEPSREMPPGPPAEGEPAGRLSRAADAGEIAAEAESAHRGPSVADTTIRVDVGLLDKLMNLVGELVLARNQILQYSARQEDAAFNATSQRLNLITTQLQEGVMKTRMQPIRTVWNKLPRMVRDLAASCGKQIQLEMEGAETELDRSIIEAIKDPLTHIVRNACDHGLETPEERVRAGKPPVGRLSLRAYHEGGQVNIEISDDGRGIDPERIKAKAIQKGLLRPDQAERMSERELMNLLFLPGFSTAERVTNISGRGVGLDVVKTNIEKIGGVVDLSSRVGEGTTVRIKIPLTLAIIPGLVIASGGERFVIPQVSLLELIRLEGEAGRRQIEWIHGTPVYRRRGALLPIAYLNQVLGLKTDENAEALNIVVLQAEDRQFGLVVDAISDTQEIVVKPLGKQLKGLNGYAGATIMGDGRVALILDVLGIGQLAGVITETREQGLGEVEQVEAASQQKQTYLLFSAGSFRRLAVPLALVARLEEFPQSKIERAGGRMVVQYRGRILPLVSLTALLDPAAEDLASGQDPAQAIVFSDGERSVGLLVDQILDIVEEAVEIKAQQERPGLLGSAVIGGKVTDIVDLRAVLERADPAWLRAGTDMRRSGVTVLLADGSSFWRGMARCRLEMAGHRVLEAGHLEEALEKLKRSRVDVVAVALDLPGGAAGLVEEIRRQPALAGVPVLALTSAAQDAPVAQETFADCQARFDQEAVLSSIERLAAAVARAESRPITIAG